MQLESDLLRALEQGQLVLRYQPKLGMHTGGIVGVQVQPHWLHPVDGLLPLARFDSELAGRTPWPVFEWTVRMACRQGRLWNDERLPRCVIGVKLTERQLAAPGLCPLVEEALEQSGFEPAQLEIGLPEDSLAQEPEHPIAALRRLRALGVRICVNGFGAKYLSLAQLNAARHAAGLSVE